MIPVPQKPAINHPKHIIPVNYDDNNYSYNWDDSWDDKWLHQGKYADDRDSHDEYTDYDPSWDDHFRK